MKRIFFPVFWLIFGCHANRPVSGISYKGYQISRTAKVDSVYIGMLRPYADSLGKTMDEELAFLPKELLKETPNSTLGNFLTDAYLFIAREKFDAGAEIAFMNHGGVRINRFAQGNVTRRMVYEVMPFDNTLVVVEVKGDILQSYLDKLASEGGGGGVSGLTMSIKDKKAVHVMIGGKPLDPSRTYHMVNSDYAVDGGGGFSSFKKLKQTRTNYFLRDAIIEYCLKLKSDKQNIPTDPSIRITNE